MTTGQQISAADRRKVVAERIATIIEKHIQVPLVPKKCSPASIARYFAMSAGEMTIYYLSLDFAELEKLLLSVWEKFCLLFTLEDNIHRYSGINEAIIGIHKDIARLGPPSLEGLRLASITSLATDWEDSIITTITGKTGKMGKRTAQLIMHIKHGVGPQLAMACNWPSHTSVAVVIYENWDTLIQPMMDTENMREFDEYIRKLADTMIAKFG